MSARENRDTVFCQMRRAIDLIHFVIREGISPDLNAALEDADLPGVSYHDPGLGLGGGGGCGEDPASQVMLLRNLCEVLQSAHWRFHI